MHDTTKNKRGWRAATLQVMLLAGCAARQTTQESTVVQVSPVEDTARIAAAEAVPPENASEEPGLVLVPVLDTKDPLADVDGLSDRISLSEEFVNCGEGPMCKVHYAVAALAENESVEAARTRLEHALAAVDVPANTRWGVQRMPPASDDDAASKSGWRSLLLVPEVIVDGRDVVEVSQHEDDTGLSVSATLSDSAAQRLADYTREHVRTRLAIVIDGVVLSAPVIMTEIAGGKLQIHVGTSMERKALLRVVDGLRAGFGK